MIKKTTSLFLFLFLFFAGSAHEHNSKSGQSLLAKKDKLIIDFFVSDVCAGDTSHFINKTSGGDSTITFFWRFGDGSSSNLENPKHVYDSIKLTKTYAVTLIAQLSDNTQDSITKPVTVNAGTDASFTFRMDWIYATFTPKNQESLSRYFWDFDDGNYSNLMIVTHQYDSFLDRKVCLYIVNSASCKSQYCQRVGPVQGIESLKANFTALIFPNPVNNNLVIDLSKNGHYQLEIVDVHGRQVLQSDFIGDNWKGTFTDYASGMYWIKITDEMGGIAMKKVFKN
jgi:hypothetical protein